MPNHDAPAAVLKIARSLAEPKPMRRGSLSVRYVKCNKPGCPCADDPEARHGPYTSVVRKVAGKTRSRLASAAQADLLRQQVEAGQSFRKEVEAFWQVCEQWADAELDAAKEASDSEAKKGASKNASKRKSSPKSKHS